MKSARDIRKMFFILSVAFVPVLTSAQELRAPAGVGLSTPAASEVERFDGTSLAVLMNRRANRSVSRNAIDGRVFTVDRASPSDSLSYERSGVVYNYALQAYGVVSGEISFKVRDGVDASTFAWGQTSLPRRLVGPTVFVVNTPTLDEFVRVMKMLRGDGRVQWVEPAVEYIPETFK
jgi:hypothetical protein